MPQNSNSGNSPPNPPINSGPQIDTGTGGFKAGNSNEAYSYDIGQINEEGSQGPAWSPGQINVDNSKKDLSKRTKRTLASYLSDTTLGKTASSPTGVKNSFSVKNDSTENPKLSNLSNEKGFPSSLSSENEEQFVPKDTIQSRSSASKNLEIKRGKEDSDSNKVDGHGLLKDALPNTPGQVNPSAYGGKLPKITSSTISSQSPIGKYYGDPRTLSNSVIFNRFNPDTKYSTSTEDLKSNQFSKDYDPGTSQVEKRDVSLGKLSQVGISLMSKASGEMSLFSDALKDPSGGVAGAQALLPGGGQLGMRIDRSILDAKKAIEEITQDIGSESIKSPANTFWGTMNNPLDEYSGLSAVGMSLLAKALVGAVGSAMTALGFLFKLSTGSGYGDEKKDSAGRYPYGASTFDPSIGTNSSNITGIIDQIRDGKFNFWRLIGVPSTKYPLQECLNFGASSYFGNTVRKLSGGRTKADDAVDQSPGYYAVSARAIIRSYAGISDAFKSLARAFGGANIVSGIKQLIGLIEVFKNSQFMKVVGIFAKLGERCLEIFKSSEFAYDDLSGGAGIRFLSDIDKSPLNSPGRNRLLPSPDFNGVPDKVKTTQSWASFRSPDLFLMPKSISSILDASDSSLGKPQVKTSIDPDLLPGGFKTFVEPSEKDKNRISTETREYIESYLESEYVPFYMHDIRTNEILSFHAFLASLGDSYTASYDTSEAMGRVEPIKIYKGTQRKIDFSFFIVATSEKDFEAMWLKINKLTTMVYPQFNEGRKMADSSDKKFSLYAPFSQLMTASPMIRLRIGDLIKSNYSKFNLARLFGYGLDGVKFGDDKDIESLSDEDKSSELFKYSKVLKLGNTFFTNAPLNKPYREKKLPIPGAKPEQKVDTDMTLNMIGLVDSEGPALVLKLTTTELPDENGNYRFEVIKNDITLTAIQKNKIKEIESDPSKNIIGKQYLVNINDLILTKKTQNKLDKLNDDLTEDETKLANSVKSFMTDSDPQKGNAIVRSFRSSGGKGIAGFIESMSFDWYDNVTWSTDGPGLKAPKMCRVTISFSPVHDITPGLDSQGFNRAPIYPVATMSQSQPNNRKHKAPENLKSKKGNNNK